MDHKKYPATKHPRDIGKVEFAIEKMMTARELSSSCVGVEALLETDSKAIRQSSKKSRK